MIRLLAIVSVCVVSVAPVNAQEKKWDELPKDMRRAGNPPYNIYSGWLEGRRGETAKWQFVTFKQALYSERYAQLRHKETGFTLSVFWTQPLSESSRGPDKMWGYATTYMEKKIDLGERKKLDVEEALSVIFQRTSTKRYSSVEVEHVIFGERPSDGGLYWITVSQGQP